MANDCLVTKLKGVVQNDNLPKLGELSIGVENGSSVLFGCIVGTVIYSDDISFNVENLGTGVVTSNISTYTVSSEGDYRITSSVKGTVKITNKYSLFSFQVAGSNKTELNGLKYCPIRYMSWFGTSDIDIKDSVNPASLVKLENYIFEPNGSLADLGSCILLGILTTGTDIHNGVLRANIDGEILELVSLQISNGRTTGQITGTWSALLFNGERLSNDAEYRLNWEPSGANYLVTYISGANISSPTTTKSVTIDAAGNIVS